MNKYDYDLVYYLTFRYFNRRGELLDIGCGDGTHVGLFDSMGITAYGLDKELDLSKDKYPFESESFNHIFSKSFLEHVYNTNHILSETYRLLKSYGNVVFMVPDYLKQTKTFWDDPTHVKPFTQKSLVWAFENAGFKDVRCERFYQFPLVWRHPWLRLGCKILVLLPFNSMLFYHCKRPMLLLSAKKYDIID